MDYERLIDEETWAFIRRTAESYPDDAVDLSIQDQRRVYDTMCQDFRQPCPAGVETQDQAADGVPVRIYTAGQPTRTIVYFHGGGFVVGGLDSHDDVCAELCAQTGYRVVSVDYRLCPEHVHPAQFEDCWTAVNWAAREYGDPLILAGDSAGGNLSAAVAHHARGRLDGILGQVLIYPGLGGDRSQGSYLEHAHAPLLTLDDIKFYETVRCSGEQPQNDPTYAPLQDSDFSNLPPTVVVTADCDPLRDDGLNYCQRITAAGGQAHWINEPGLVHGYLRARTSVKRAAESFERISVAVEALGQGIWSYD
ncbi:MULTISPECIES: alpha/beta hydrolase [unclassified Ruegeria]|uniref:alpha/beta hydrolase n=1 Tax=unclassified Ruegeria TaxID=2625375 RepID=UPI0014886B2F|nr:MULTISPECIES: alpha/beta hydrolase [unclassified Ruegeria]NOD74614.1 alpha/beta hydrolase fold domain-containing protein [Ruegeria sp. HKCCD4332]NOD88652.1 alpha/beta hydrolase fold domain-containing protein [Ruegeria sp. HKCCD4318]NOE12120.1 alpha/beta hydrolase fold domain-containing protein [Ruegeria sp. HKCCD4318-2]NOG09716.1 alpha/beta hydrolase [Ruegeria sp. HKCCD4315]